jgi:hypothetical protein
MISDNIMTNINRHFRNKTTLTLNPLSSHPTHNNVPSRLTPQLIKQNLSSLIRRDNGPSIIINETRPKSPSPISKSRLKMVLESSKQENLRSVVKRSPARGGQLTCKTSVSDLLDCKGFQGKSVVSEYDEEKDKENLLEAYRQKRKEELQKDLPSKSSKKIFNRRA